MRSGMNTPAEPSGITLSLIDLDDIFALRKAVLRPWLTPAGSRAAYADGAERFHVGAARGGRIVSTASFKIETPDEENTAALDRKAGGKTLWRLLSMATYPEFQGQGLGGRVLIFALDELARRLAARGEDRAILWCNGRTPARNFYERHGFAAIGAEFETPGTGPHYVFWRTVDAA